MSDASREDEIRERELHTVLELDVLCILASVGDLVANLGQPHVARAGGGAGAGGAGCGGVDGAGGDGTGGGGAFGGDGGGAECGRGRRRACSRHQTPPRAPKARLWRSHPRDDRASPRDAVPRSPLPWAGSAAFAAQYGERLSAAA
eukprot:6776499-Prymnesium_polylepis.2